MRGRMCAVKSRDLGKVEKLQVAGALTRTTSQRKSQMELTVSSRRLEEMELASIKSNPPGKKKLN